MYKVMHRVANYSAITTSYLRICALTDDAKHSRSSVSKSMLASVVESNLDWSSGNARVKVVERLQQSYVRFKRLMNLIDLMKTHKLYYYYYYY